MKGAEKNATESEKILLSGPQINNCICVNKKLEWSMG